MKSVGKVVTVLGSSALRSPGNNCNSDNCNAAEVNSGGTVNANGNNVNNTGNAPRAALSSVGVSQRHLTQRREDVCMCVHPVSNMTRLSYPAEIAPKTANEVCSKSVLVAKEAPSKVHSSNMANICTAPLQALKTPQVGAQAQEQSVTEIPKEILKRKPFVPGASASYWNISSFETLLDAYYAARKNKLSKSDVIEFSNDLLLNIARLQSSMRAAYETPKTDYKPVLYRLRNSDYYQFKIFDPKERDIQAIPFKHRVVMHALCDNVLMPYFNTRLIDDNAACRVGKGMNYAVGRFRTQLTKFKNTNLSTSKKGEKIPVNSGHYLKIDVKKYFPSINKNILIKLLEPHFKKMAPKDYLLHGFTRHIINSFEGQGLPMGNQTSQIFALFFLDRIDRIMKEQMGIKCYTHYMDDIIIVHRDKQYLKECLAKIKDVFANELELELSPKKTIIGKISDGVLYLGWVFSLDQKGKVLQKMSTQNKKKLRKNLKALAQKRESRTIKPEEYFNKINAYHNHYSKGDTFRLLDNMYNTYLGHSFPVPKEQRSAVFHVE